MNETWKVFFDAAKETPRLYFAPIRGFIVAAKQASAAMAGEQAAKRIGKMKVVRRHLAKAKKSQR